MRARWRLGVPSAPPAPATTVASRGAGSRLPPEHGLVVDRPNRVTDPALCPVFAHRGSARREGTEIVDDHEPTDGNLRFQRHQRSARRFVEITIESQDRDRLDWGTRQRLLEPTNEELHLIIEEAVAREVCAHRVDVDGEVI